MVDLVNYVEPYSVLNFKSRAPTENKQKPEDAIISSGNTFIRPDEGLSAPGAAWPTCR